MMIKPIKAMMIGAHPDDCDGRTYSVTKHMVGKGCSVKYVSVTNGDAGHQTLYGEELAEIRLKESNACAEVMGIEYELLPFHDGRLVPSLEAREELIRVIRRFNPDVIFTNRINDYHPDHRATGELVRDAAYLLGVPAIAPDVPSMRKTPVILYWRDTFTDPRPFRPDFARPIDSDRELWFSLKCIHKSQYLDWLPWVGDGVDLTGKSFEERVAYLRKKFDSEKGDVTEAVYNCLLRDYGKEIADNTTYAESWEISEYGARPDENIINLLIGLD